MVNVGGFFASLKLVTDEDSFKSGIGMLNKIPGMLGKTAVGIAGVATAFVAMGASSATALTKLADNAKVLGLSARQLDNWRNAARIAGGDADAFQDSLSSLNKTFFNLKIGDVDKGMIQALGMSQADFGKMQTMPMQAKIDYVLAKLENISDPDKQKALTLQLLGQNGLTMLAQNQLTGRKFSDAYANASQRNLYTDKDYSVALAGKRSLDETKVSLEELFNKIGIEIEGALLPALQDFAAWLKNNKTMLTDFAKAIGGLVSLILGAVSGVAGAIGNASDIKNYLEKRSLSDIGKANENIRLLFGNSGGDSEYYKKFKAGQLTIDQINKIDASPTRYNLFKAGQDQLAYGLSDESIKIIEAKSNAMARALYPGAVPGESDARLAPLQQSVLSKAEKTLNIKITSDGKLTDNQVQMISKAINTMGNTQ